MHVHSCFSCDSEVPMAAQAEAAVRVGLEGLAFAEHVEWQPEDGAYHYLRPDAYFAALGALRARYRDELTLLAGVEVGDAHLFGEAVAALLEAWPWDYVLGSAHWVEGQPGWTVETFGDDLAVAYRRYFGEVARLAWGGDFDVLAHLDLVRRDSWALFGEERPLDAFEDVIRQALQAVIDRGKGIEINTSSWRAGLEHAMPDLTVLRWYRELGGEVLVFGSDAHRSAHVGMDFDRARQLALAAGFTKLARFERRQIVGWEAL